MSNYVIELPVFNGPLDLLLHLIEREELDITAVSLARVTEQYLSQVELMDEDRVEQLIDFIGIGARLVLIKSRALLPREPVFGGDEDEEEDPAEALLRQLRAYKRFKEAAGWLKRRQELGLRTYLRVAPPPRLEGKLDLTGVDVETLHGALLAALSRMEMMEESVILARPRVMTIEDRLASLRSRLRLKDPFRFEAILSRSVDRTEVGLTLLALLELIKRREAQASQPFLFGPIEIEAGTGIPDGAADGDGDVMGEDAVEEEMWAGGD